MQIQTIKCRTIFVATDEGTQVFRSAKDIPPRLRKVLRRKSSGMQSATIVIADRKGREHIARTLRDAADEGARTDEASSIQVEPVAASKRPLRLWMDITVLAALILLCWLVAILR